MERSIEMSGNRGSDTIRLKMTDKCDINIAITFTMYVY